MDRTFFTQTRRLIASACLLLAVTPVSADWGRISIVSPNGAPAPFHYSAHHGGGPHEWKGLCRHGTMQSPVNIVEADDDDTLQPLTFRGPCLLTKALNTTTAPGHTVTLSDSGMDCRVVHPLTAQEYPFAQMHFHAPGEHAFRGHRAAMEIHAVFKLSDEQGSTVVVAVGADPKLGKVEPANATTDSPKSRRRKDAHDGLAGPSAVEVGASGVGDLTAALNEETKRLAGRALTRLLLPTERTQYVTYVGSLTTPPCTERIRWIVVEPVVRVKQSVISQFRSHMRRAAAASHGKYEEWSGNARPLQSLGRRAVSRSNPAHSPADAVGVSARLHKVRKLVLAVVALLVFVAIAGLLFHIRDSHREVAEAEEDARELEEDTVEYGETSGLRQRSQQHYGTA